MLAVNIIETSTMYDVQELHLCIFLVKVISVILTSSILSVHSPTNLSTNYFLQLQFL